ncbi:MAG: hypothetical protein ABDH20_13180 [Thermus sp.]
MDLRELGKRLREAGASRLRLTYFHDSYTAGLERAEALDERGNPVPLPEGLLKAIRRGFGNPPEWLYELELLDPDPFFAPGGKIQLHLDFLEGKGEVETVQGTEDLEEKLFHLPLERVLEKVGWQGLPPEDTLACWNGKGWAFLPESPGKETQRFLEALREWTEEEHGRGEKGVLTFYRIQRGVVKAHRTREGFYLLEETRERKAFSLRKVEE